MALSETWIQDVIDREVEGTELVLLEEIGGRRQKVIRLYIDHPNGVTHELCGRVSGVVGQALDESDAIDVPYTLEVSSPGVERPLRKRGHFEAQIGKKVCVKTRMPIDGAKVWQGTLLEVDLDAIVVGDAGRVARIPFAEIGSAHLIFEFE